MGFAIALTLYLSFGAFLFFGTMGAPPVFARLAIGLCASELVVAVAWGASREGCRYEKCGDDVAALASAAGVQIPALTGATLLLAAVYGLHVARRW